MHDSAQHRHQRGSTPAHTDADGSSPHPNPRSRTSSDVSVRSGASPLGQRSSAIILSPNMLPAVSPSVSNLARSSPLMTPLIPLHSSLRDSGGLSPIPQSPSTADATPMSRGSKDANATPALPPSAYPASGNTDYFSLRSRRPSVSTAPTPDDFAGWGGKAPVTSTSAPDSALATPSTPSSLMGRIKAFGGRSKRQASETAGPATQGGTNTAAATDVISGVSRVVVIAAVILRLTGEMDVGCHGPRRDEDSSAGAPVRSSHTAPIQRGAWSTYTSEHGHPYLGGSAVRLAYVVSWTCLEYRRRCEDAGGSHASVAP